MSNATLSGGNAQVKLSYEVSNARWYPIYDIQLRPEAGRVEIRRVAYDVAEARRKIEAAGLPRFLADRLVAGA